MRRFNIPSVLSETLRKVIAERLAVKKLAVATQTRSWPHLCKAFNHDQHCSPARQDLIVPARNVQVLDALSGKKKSWVTLKTTLPVTPLLLRFVRIACDMIILSLVQ